jgi:hypothetical protein
METREMELARRKVRRDEAPLWSLEFEDSNAGTYIEWNTKLPYLKWKFSRYRGREFRGRPSLFLLSRYLP